MPQRLARWEQDYLRVLQRLARLPSQDAWRGNRTGVRTVSEFGIQLDVPLAEGVLPAMVTKQVHLRSVFAELLWFIRGETNIESLHRDGCTIWDEWADANGDLGPVYGAQWRAWPMGDVQIDQLLHLVDNLRGNPDSRRMIVSAWNPAALPEEALSPQDNVSQGQQALAPCHMLFQAYTHPLGIRERADLAEARGMAPRLQYASEYGAAALHEMLDGVGIPRRGLQLRVDQRSADWVLGVPFNILSYATLAHLLCQVVPGLTPTRLVMQFGDCHLYENQVEAAQEHLRRGNALPADGELSYPLVDFAMRGTLEELQVDDIRVTGYRHMGKISAPVAI
ncbi:hypothetical protein BJP27_24525 (plasmid) [Pseudomonas oryzihabitans]|nr:hypothetical protein BJP27_23875 [Pseudomonas psychrotolerans]APQ14765.1 hypothetical protein BJP27_24525 [Pseudomonas psychrotolerans]